MSFLAGLRERQPDKQQNLQLSYRLSIDCVSRSLFLQLHLRNEQDLRQSTSGKRYKLQREHLVRPPAFLSTVDQVILRELSGADECWFDCDGASFPGLVTWSLLKTMLETERCYLATASDQWQRLRVGHTRSVEPFWSIKPSIEYQLCWRIVNAENTDSVVFLANDVLHLSAIDSGLAIGPTESQARNSGAPLHALIPLLRLSSSFPLSLPYSQREDFSEEDKERWRNWNIPMPQAVTSVTVEAQLKPILYCVSEREGSRDVDKIALQFSLCSERYCSLPASNPTVLAYWDGEQLNELSGEQREIEHHKTKIADCLTPFVKNDKTQSVWLPKSEKNWQLLFGELRPSIAALDVSFSFAPSFRHHYVMVQHWLVAISEHESKGLNVSIEMHSSDGHIDLSELLAQLKAFNLHAKDEHLNIPLADGRILLVSANEMCNLMEELEGLDVSSEGFHIEPSQRHRLAQLQEQLPSGTKWSGKVEHLDDAIALHNSPVVLDRNLDCVDAELRSYQWLGVSWVRHLKQHGCNGLLADDMGLGKTIQALTLLAFEKQQGELKKPALIIVPLSLVHNWVAEIKRFVSQLSVKVIHGQKRHDDWKGLARYDILITTYNLAAIDLLRWQSQDLSWLILDEAQNIKNPKTRFSQAMREIPSDNRLCLSGTPVENHLGELWSIISFLMPGSLGTLKDFKTQFQKPIEQEGNSRRMQQLLARVAPFMLRRTKDQIAQDLPAKTEISQLIPLYEDQREFYEQLKRDTWQDLQAKTNGDEKAGKNHIAALTALLKLRQVCCDPALFPDMDIPSAKRDYCVEMIEELVAENRAVLVFSQFTKMLDILEETLEEKNIASLMLTGKSRNRQDIVDAFQRGDAAVFLISLKAGGTGLNLTRADTVIHYDPWWNSAAEKQASDRAHRIGQDKPVFVYKLIAEDTIEEKIAQLQAQKSILSDHVDNQALLNAESFAFKFEELLTLWEDE